MSKSNVKQVSFKKNEGDLLEYIEKNNYDKNFSYYVKRLIREDMNRNTPGAKEEKIIESKVNNEICYKKRNVDFDF